MSTRCLACWFVECRCKRPLFVHFFGGSDDDSRMGSLGNEHRVSGSTRILYDLGAIEAYPTPGEASCDCGECPKGCFEEACRGGAGR